MNKKQRNRKLVSQNKRNRLSNRRYTSTVKSIFKLFMFKVNNLKPTNKLNLLDNINIKTENFEEKYIVENNETYKKGKKEIENLLNNFYSIIDKAVKKNVIHKNTAAKKKSRIGKIFYKI
jgi:small subunit ribosomal protein S20